MVDLDRILVKRAAQAHNSFLGKRITALSERIGGVSAAASLNILFTAALGFIITFPIYRVGGFWLALPTGAFTILLMLFLFLGILSYRFQLGKPYARKLLVFAILFSLPFGLLSLPLLQELSKNHKE